MQDYSDTHEQLFKPPYDPDFAAGVTPTKTAYCRYLLDYTAILLYVPQLNILMITFKRGGKYAELEKLIIGLDYLSLNNNHKRGT